jgi:hypothetical protein
MGRTISKAITLAMSAQAQPGLYAVLLGAGVSTGAGVPTGWDIVRDLVRKVAELKDPDNPDLARLALDDPEQWWITNGEGDLGYSALLAALAPTASGRQALLAHYFEPEGGEPQEPSRAHRAIAELVKMGTVRVIVTTNFDRLMETALAEVGIAPRVISTLDQVAGMTPMQHATATVIKIHGDYLDAETLNTPEELATYPSGWRDLLNRVFSEYGLIISGWSAEWDKALRDAIDGSTRRYPLYWDRRSSGGPLAKSLLANRGGIVIPATSADELFEQLLENLRTLDRLAEPPLTAALAVGRLKRYLPDPVKRIELHDLLIDVTDEVAAWVVEQDVSYNAGVNGRAYQDRFDQSFRATEKLLRLVIAGTWFDPQGIHDQLWIDVLQRLVDAGASSQTTSMSDTRLWPALLLFTAAGVVASARGRESLFLRMGTEVTGRTAYRAEDQQPVAQRLHTARVLEKEVLRLSPRWGGSVPLYPASRLIKTVLAPVFTDFIPSSDAYERAFAGYEYRAALIQARLADDGDNYPAAEGEYMGERSWNHESPHRTYAAVAFEKDAVRHADWPWTDYLGGPAAAAAHIASLDVELLGRRRRA